MHIYRRTTHAQTVNSDRFLEMLFFTHSFRSLLWFGSLNALLTLPVEKYCVGKTKPQGETGDIILLNESLKFIQNVASCQGRTGTKFQAGKSHSHPGHAHPIHPQQILKPDNNIFCMAIIIIA